MGKIRSFFGALKQKLNANKDKAALLFAGAPMSFALGAETTAGDLSTFLDTIKGALADFTTANLATILVATLGITAVLAICWFGYRFIVRKTSGAMKGGKL